MYRESADEMLKFLRQNDKVMTFDDKLESNVILQTPETPWENAELLMTKRREHHGADRANCLKHSGKVQSF